MPLNKETKQKKAVSFSLGLVRLFSLMTYQTLMVTLYQIQFIYSGVWQNKSGNLLKAPRISLIDRTVIGAATLDPSGPGSNSNECVTADFHELQNSSLTTGRSLASLEVGYPLQEWTPLSSEIWVSLYHCRAPTRMALALNNPRSLICL